MLVFGFLFVVISWLVGFLFFLNVGGVAFLDFSAEGTFAALGDSFGILNSLFTGLALSAIVVAIIMQNEQLKAQQEANELYKEEVSATLDNLERENEWRLFQSKQEVLPFLSAVAERKLIADASSIAEAKLDFSADSELFGKPERLQEIRAQIQAAEARLRSSLDIAGKSLLQLEKDYLGMLKAKYELQKDVETKSARENIGILIESYDATIMSIIEEVQSQKKAQRNMKENISAIERLTPTLQAISNIQREYSESFEKAYKVISQNPKS